ncbi:hypothetical protein Tco_1361918 [Tanacetum coccineum]
MDGRKVKRESDHRRPSEQRTEEGGSHGGYLPPILTTHLGKSYYDMKGDPDNYLHLLKGIICMQKWAMLVTCHMFTYTLKDSARIWCNGQKVCSIVNYEDLKEKIRSYFSQQKKFTKTHLVVHNIKQRDGESTMAFVTRYTDNNLQILGLHAEQRIFSFVHGLKTRSLVEFLSTDLPTTYKGLMEKTYTWIEAKEVSTNGASNDIKEGFDKINNGFSWVNNKERKKKQDRVRISGRQVNRVYMDSEKELKGTFHQNNHAENGDRSVHYSCSYKFHSPCGIGTVFSMYEPNKVEEGQKQVKETNPELLTSLKRKLKDLLRSNANVFAWTYADMTRIPRTIMVGGKPFNTEHKFNEYRHIEPVKQKKCGLAQERNEAPCKEVDELTMVGILREVKYQTWVANLVMVKKCDGRWRMCMDVTDINKACPKDCYPLPAIDWKVKSLLGF